jgi:diacylglycerol kinase (ATP)
MQRSSNLFKSFLYAIEGIQTAIKFNRNLRIHFLIAIIVIILSFYFRINFFEAGIVGVMIILVISAEMINSVIEEMVNLISKEHHAEAKIAKDVSAGMVLITSIGAVIMGLFVFIPHLINP